MKEKQDAKALRELEIYGLLEENEVCMEMCDSGSSLPQFGVSHEFHGIHQWPLSDASIGGGVVRWSGDGGPGRHGSLSRDERGSSSRARVREYQMDGWGVSSHPGQEFRQLDAGHKHSLEKGGSPSPNHAVGLGRSGPPRHISEEQNTPLFGTYPLPPTGSLAEGWQGSISRAGGVSDAPRTSCDASYTSNTSRMSHTGGVRSLSPSWGADPMRGAGGESYPSSDGAGESGFRSAEVGSGSPANLSGYQLDHPNSSPPDGHQPDPSSERGQTKGHASPPVPTVRNRPSLESHVSQMTPDTPATTGHGYPIVRNMNQHAYVQERQAQLKPPPPPAQARGMQDVEAGRNSGSVPPQASSGIQPDPDQVDVQDVLGEMINHLSSKLELNGNEKLSSQNVEVMYGTQALRARLLSSHGYGNVQPPLGRQVLCITEQSVPKGFLFFSKNPIDSGFKPGLVNADDLESLNNDREDDIRAICRQSDYKRNLTLSTTLTNPPDSEEDQLELQVFGETMPDAADFMDIPLKVIPELFAAGIVSSCILQTDGVERAVSCCWWICPCFWL